MAINYEVCSWPRRDEKLPRKGDARQSEKYRGHRGQRLHYRYRAAESDRGMCEVKVRPAGHFFSSVLLPKLLALI